MEDLTRVHRGQCLGCKNIIEYVKLENLSYDLKEDSMFCLDCYNGKISILRNYGHQLGSNQVFYGLGKNEINREMGVFNKIRHLEDYIQYTQFPQLLDWFALMKDNVEESLVPCGSCQKQIRNHPKARFTFNNERYYACSGECKMKVISKAKKEQKSNRITQSIMERMKQGEKPTDEEQI